MLKEYNRIMTRWGHYDYAHPNDEQLQIWFYWRDNAPDEVKQIDRFIVSDRYIWTDFEEWDVDEALEVVKNFLTETWYYRDKNKHLANIEVALQYVQDISRQDKYDFWNYKYEMYKDKMNIALQEMNDAQEKLNE
jgi:hypothetical protein